MTTLRKLHAIENAKLAVTRKPVPNVQRPGARAPQVSRANVDIAALDRQLTQTGSLEVAAKLLAARARARGE
ncbi:hypothetical protein ABIF34_003238 [Bradyrhizobium japonicum]